jgi:hypothetical protein
MRSMKSLRFARRILLVSCVLFFAVLGSFFLTLALDVSPEWWQVAVLVLLWLALLWQVFTVYHCGRLFVVRLLLYIYGIAALALTIAAMY